MVSYLWGRGYAGCSASTNAVFNVVLVDIIDRRAAVRCLTLQEHGFGYTLLLVGCWGRDE
jgi:hypothetical protein